MTAWHGRRAWIDPVLAEHYVYVGRGPQWTWYVARSVGPQVTAAVRAANAAAMGVTSPVLAHGGDTRRPNRLPGGARAAWVHP